MDYGLGSRVKGLGVNGLAVHVCVVCDVWCVVRGVWCLVSGEGLPGSPYKPQKVFGGEELPGWPYIPHKIAGQTSPSIHPPIGNSFAPRDFLP